MDNTKFTSLRTISPPTIYNQTTRIYEGIPGACAAPSTAGMYASLWPTNSSALGGFSSTHFGSSNTPALIITAPAKVSPVRITVVPQSPQKCEVIFLPVSACFEMVLGVPSKVRLLVQEMIRAVGQLERDRRKQGRKYQIRA